MTNSFGEFSSAKMFLIIGSNMTEAHPVAATFLKNAVMNGAELILVDPRKQPLAGFATMHVPLKVGSDIAFLNGLMNVLIAEDLYDKEFVANSCKGFDELREQVKEYTPEYAAGISGVSPDMIREVARKLASAEFLVCSDIFPTETTRFADVVFPAAAWSEDDGTFSSSERRVSRVRKVSRAPGQAKPNWWIFREVARKMGHEWKSDSGPEIRDNEVSVLAPALAGIKFRRIETDGLQWPCPNEDHPGTPVLHRGGVFTSGKGQFTPVEWTPPAEVPDKEYPYVLSTGRRLYHYHTRTQTGRCGLNELLGEETADISPEDAHSLGILRGEFIRVKSRRGEVKVKAKVTDQVPKGMVWMAFHFRDGNANWLTNAAFDPFTQTAEYKACAVVIEKI